MDQFKWLSLISLLILSLLVAVSHGQGGAGGDDGSSSDGSDGTDTAPEPADPNIVAPTNRQGYGKNVDTHLTKKQTKALKITVSTVQPIGEQSILAMQQFAVLVGVAMMVIILFILNIWLDMLLDWISEGLTNLFCKKKVKVSIDAENPAAIVGTFKRYK